MKFNSVLTADNPFYSLYSAIGSDLIIFPTVKTVFE